MKNIKIIIKTRNKNYPFIIGENVIKKTGLLIKKNLPKTKKIAIITDRNLPSKILSNLKLSLKKYDISIYKLNAGEKTKNIKIAYYLIEKILRKKFSRSDCIISLGGGVIGDLAGLVSSLVKRGVKFVNIPTTLLAQADSSIGGKTGVNSSYGKNLIGTFYQPDLVITDTTTLNSLPKKEIICGYAEIFKHSLILDKNFFVWLQKNGKKLVETRNKKILKKAILKSCKIKSKIVNQDEKEKNLRMILNFGHTFGHAFEAVKNYSKKLNHGEAVLLGMVLASQFSFENKILPFKDLLMIKKHYFDLNLPINIKKYFKKKEIKKIIQFMKNDKKNINSNINLVLLKNIGKTTFSQTPDIKIKNFLNLKFE